MNSKALHILEYDKIIERLTSYATSEPGKELCRNLVPTDDTEAIGRLLSDTTAASSRIFAKGSLSFSGLKDIRMYVKSLEVGSVLGIRELLDIAVLLHITAKALTYNGETADLLTERFEALNPVKELHIFIMPSFKSFSRTSISVPQEHLQSHLSSVS